jgi:lipoprotein-anchoring transpeptidase ErfK/SrfK
MRTADHELRRLRNVAVLLMAAAVEALADQAVQTKRRIVVDIPNCKVAVLEDGRVLKVYRAATGAAATPTPAGTYEIVQRIPHPTWYAKKRVVPPGKANPLGTRWMGLSRKGYGIHGTNNPRSIGRRASHGCVRLCNADAEELFEMVAVGDVVELHDQPDPELDRIFGTVELASAAGGQQ